MPRYKLTIEYNGLRFSGWQKQNESIPTIQRSLEIAISKFCGNHIIIEGASRTDKGVHAIGQVAHFDLEKEYNSDSIRNGINFYLNNKDISILKVEKVNEDFHARKLAIKKIYVYKILNQIPPSPLHFRSSWHIIQPLDIDLMRVGANILIGKHNFTSFRSSYCQSKSPIKTLNKINLEKFSNFVIVTFEAPSFLHNQIRIMIGTLKLIGSGKISKDCVYSILKSEDRSKAGPTAPSHGLYLMEIIYPEPYHKN